MTYRDELALLDQVEAEHRMLAEEAEELTGIPRREFLFLSLVSAAATTFGFGAKALAQGGGGGGAQGAPQAPLPPLGNGDPVAARQRAPTIFAPVPPGFPASRITRLVVLTEAEPPPVIASEASTEVGAAAHLTYEPARTT